MQKKKIASNFTSRSNAKLSWGERRKMSLLQYYHAFKINGSSIVASPMPEII